MLAGFISILNSDKVPVFGNGQMTKSDSSIVDPPILAHSLFVSLAFVNEVLYLMVVVEINFTCIL